MKLYQDSNGIWHYDTTTLVAGDLRLKDMGDEGIHLYWGNSKQPIFRGDVGELEREDGSPYEDVDTLLTECKDFFVNPLNPLAEDVEGLQEDVSAIQGGYLGTLLHTDAAPEPGVSGIYKFISAGVVSWLSGTPTVAVGDEVSVVFTDPTYTYKHIQNPYESLANKTQTLTDSETDYPSGRAVYEPMVNTEHATADALNYLLGRIQALEAFIEAKQYGDITVDKIISLNEINLNGANMYLEGVGVPSFVPDRLHQRYIDTSSKIAYTAVGTSSSADWKRDTTA